MTAASDIPGPARVIQVFARAPVDGEVKTRLIPALGARGAARLHARMVEHALQVAAEAARELAAGLELWSTGDDPSGWIQVRARHFGARLRAQAGDGLGERMREALDTALGAGARAVLVGSDCPARVVRDFAAAFAALDTGHDAVLQPAEDGGYTLVGLSRSAPALFAGIEWGGARVCEQTRARAREGGLSLALLPPTWDVDRVADLRRLATLGPPWTALCGDAARSP